MRDGREGCLGQVAEGFKGPEEGGLDLRTEDFAEMAKKHSSEAFYALDDPPGGGSVFGASGDDEGYVSSHWRIEVPTDILSNDMFLNYYDYTDGNFHRSNSTCLAIITLKESQGFRIV